MRHMETWRRLPQPSVLKAGRSERARGAWSETLLDGRYDHARTDRRRAACMQTEASMPGGTSASGLRGRSKFPASTIKQYMQAPLLLPHLPMQQ